MRPQVPPLNLFRLSLPGSRFKTTKALNAAKRKYRKSVAVRVNTSVSSDRTGSVMPSGLPSVTLLEVSKKKPSFKTTRPKRTQLHDKGYKPEPETLSLSTLSPNKGSTKLRKRVGRGIGSGHGLKSGRGSKGEGVRQARRSRMLNPSGQTPFWKTPPRRGWYKLVRQPLPQLLTLSRLTSFIKNNYIDPRKPITLRELVRSGCVTGKVSNGVHLIVGHRDAGIAVPKGLNITLSHISRKAAQAVESNGGTATARYMSPLSIRGLVAPEAFINKNRRIPSHPNPVKQGALVHYSDIKKRGYLAKEFAARLASGEETSVSPSALYALEPSLNAWRLYPGQSLGHVEDEFLKLAQPAQVHVS